MSTDGWDTTDLGKQGGETFSADYDPARGVVRLSGTGIEPEEFPVDAGQWEQQAARELAARGYGNRWNQWEPGQDGTRVMSTARTHFPDADYNHPRPQDRPSTAGGTDDGWERGAASYSASAAAAPDAPPPAYQPPQYGRVRVYPTYTFPVFQSGAGGIGLDQEIVVTDFDKKGRQWAEQEARRQVSEALGAPPNTDDTPGGAWWMGQPKKDQFRWQPLKGTPRDARPNDGLPETPPWTPWRASETGDGPTARQAEIMKTAMTGHDGQVPDGLAGRDAMINAGMLDEQGRVTAAGQEQTREYVRNAPGYQPDRRYEGVLGSVDAYTPPDGTGTGTDPDPRRVGELVDEAFPPNSDEVEAAMRAGGTGPAYAETDPDMRFGADGEWIPPAEYDRRVDAAAAAGTPFVLRGQDVQEGDRVLDTGNGELGTVREGSDRGVRVEYDRELTPGHPGSKGVHMLGSALEGGSLQQVPRDATYASLEDRRPPAEQAERYAERRAHYDEQHGPGKRGKKGWTAHKRGCRVCSDIDDGGDGTGRRLQSVPPVETGPAPAETGPGTGRTEPRRYAWAGDGDGSEIRHWRWDAAHDALNDQVGGWTIPDDGTGVLDTDAFIASISGYVAGLAGVLAQLGEDFGSGETPIAPVVGETLADFAASLAVMADEAAAVHERWQSNEDNAHDLRRAHGEIPGAHLFNVQSAA